MSLEKWDVLLSCENEYSTLAKTGYFHYGIQIQDNISKKWYVSDDGYGDGLSKQSADF